MPSRRDQTPSLLVLVVRVTVSGLVANAIGRFGLGLPSGSITNPVTSTELVLKSVVMATEVFEKFGSLSVT